MNTGEIIKELRERRGLSQEELAKAAGYKDRSMIAKLESGSSDPSQRMLKRLAQALEVSPSELLDDPERERRFETVLQETPDGPVQDALLRLLSDPMSGNLIVILDVIQQLSPEERQEILSHASWLLSKREQ